MKTKAIILLAVSAVITLSFTFATVQNETPKQEKVKIGQDSSQQPAGGFVIEDKF